jgi:phage tail-like protein
VSYSRNFRGLVALQVAPHAIDLSRLVEHEETAPGPRTGADLLTQSLKGFIMPARSYVAGNFQLVLDGVKAGFLKSVDGGAAVAEVVTEAVGSSQFSKKHLGRVSYAPFTLQFGLAMGRSLYDWIDASWRGKAVSRDGAIVMADQNFTAVSQREFSKALITETSIPALDGAAKDAAFVTLKFAPEYTRVIKASGRVSGPTNVDQKLWLPSNFRVAIDGLDCTRVSRVDQFTVSQAVATDDIGDARDYRREPGRLEFPNLTISLAEASAKSWFDWFDDFVIKGNNDESKEKNGSISFLSANLADELLRIDLFNLGIFMIGADKTEANADQIATVSAHLYCERMTLSPGKPMLNVKVKGQRARVKGRSRSKVKGQRSKAKGN